MKKIILLLVIALGFFACKDTDESAKFDVSIPDGNIWFEAIAGGAVMHYTLPEYSDIVAIQARYKDAYGTDMLKIATYATDTLVLDGFNEVRESVPVYVSFLDRYDNESEEIVFSVNTLASAPEAFFDGLEVLPYWNGFQVKYEGPAGGSGFCNVFILGTNPVTQELDTLLLETFTLATGKNVKYFSLDSLENEENTVVLKTEDFRGNVVRQKIFPGIASLRTQKFDNSVFELLDPFNLSVENDANTYKLGKKYLFDGDTKGSQKVAETESLGGTGVQNMYTFLAGPMAVNTIERPRYFILDIKESLRVSCIRMYAMVYPYGGMAPGFQAHYANKLPNHAVIYASNDKDDDNSWVEVGSFYESPISSSPWCLRSADYRYGVTTLEALDKVDPIYFDINFSDENPAYRYFKIEVNGVFKENFDFVNTLEYVTLHEIEVYGMNE